MLNNSISPIDKTLSGSDGNEEVLSIPHNSSITGAYQIVPSPGGNTRQGTNDTATCLPSRKLSKLDEPDMQDNAGEAGTSS